ncbi:MAG: transcription termination factor Rho [Candidatus Chisholmbacteria bacterium RIFCSPHIGHO2_01_FULL_49_18]|uniref:Transcription termination factor Rho n=1 Tax=Candidatus Chisholmbacteria bacterium RIFCSPHIGHO2_01_FULL_49_18 TaxID=1797590 RepID=A0A1G1VMA2_9BACT|nr:MAG: transcription termination factor Rho [Candidatus Chisholmbacteria bacterium RIFCSPHIGHO2_01_FULL_49_18]
MAVRATSSKRRLIPEAKTSAKKENDMSNTKPVMAAENPIIPQETAKEVTVEQIVGDGVDSQSTVSESAPVPVPDASVAMPQTPGGVGFTGFVDDRIIPDAGLPTEIVSGILDTRPEGHGLLRPKFAPSTEDIYISTSQIRRFALRPGDLVEGPARRPKENERYWGLLKVEQVNGKKVSALTRRVNFDQLIPIFPNEKLVLETGKEPLSNRVIDLVAPIGKGQRGLIVSPPKAGKTTILKDIAAGVAANYPDVHIMAVLIGERPEEVTDIGRHIEKVTNGTGEIASSNFDEPAEQQTWVAETALERAKRLVEMGRDVVIVLDSITRLARAYNLAIPTSGRTLSGGFDPAALYPPKRFFGAARNFEPFETPDGNKTASMTILGTALVETGSRMDDLIYEEFKGTGNMELHLDRHLSDRRIFPSIDVQRSGTRKEELLFDSSSYQSIVIMRRMIDVLNKDERTELLIDRLRKSKNNKEFLASLKEG